MKKQLWTKVSAAFLALCMMATTLPVNAAAASTSVIVPPASSVSEKDTAATETDSAESASSAQTDTTQPASSSEAAPADSVPAESVSTPEADSTESSSASTSESAAAPEVSAPESTPADETDNAAPSAATEETVVENETEVQDANSALNADAKAANDPVVEFTDENSRGGWAKTSGNGTISFTDGEGENGFMTVASNGNTIFADANVPARAEGYVEMDLTMTEAPTGSRMAIIFHYNGPNDWDGIGVDGGSWTWFTGSGSYGSVDSKKNIFTSAGEKHTIRVEYRGKTVRVLCDGEEIINTTISQYGGNAGNIGMRLWGQADPGWDGHCAFKVDNVKTGEIVKEATISPEKFTVPYEDAGKNDLTVTLGADNAELTGISAGDKALVKDTDYTVSDKTVTIKASYVASIKEAALTSLTFAFADGQSKTCDIVVEKPEEIVNYTRDFSKGIEGFEMVSGDGVLTAENGAAVMEGNGVFIDQNSGALKNQEVEFTYDPANNNCNYGVVLRYTDANNYIYVGPDSQNSQHYTNWGIYTANGKVVGIQDSGFVLSGRVQPYKVKVRIVDNYITIFLDNEEIYNGEVAGLPEAAGKTGFRSTASTKFSVYNFTQKNAAEPKAVTDAIEQATIATDAMTVTMDKNFPRVIQYELADGTVVKGQEVALHQVELNNTLYTPQVSSNISGTTATYNVKVAELGISFDTVFTVEGNVLTMKIQNVKEGDTKLYTVNFPGHSLVSMSSADANGKLVTNNYQAQNTVELASAQASAAYGETTLAVLSNDKAAAAVNGLSYKNRHEIAYQTFNAGDHTSTGLWVNEYTYRGLDGEVMIEEPWAKVSVTQDRNSDGKVDYQDGAIALRDDCMTRKVGADLMTDSWNMIAMNVGSEAQYPFLRILDNAKKMALATDNFSQNIIIKGYQSQGHDASHPDFANYNPAAGGLEDFLTLLEESEKYNAKVGIHINHTDVYPEAPQYSVLATTLGAWSWYDSASQIVRENDVLGEFGQSDEGMYGRMKQLYDVDTKGMIDTTYVDVFFGTRWPMYNLVNNINGQGREMALGTEYVDEMVSFSVFAHHIGSDFGGTGSLVRFVDNNQADIFTQSNLFRGANSRANDDVGIDGWQTAKNYYNAMKAFYERILPSKYLAQFPLMQWESNTKAVLGNNNEVVTEMVNGVNVITKDGKKIADGNKIFIPWDAETEEKIYHWNTDGGESTWELPNSWSNVKTAALYKLSETGKELVETVDVSSGSITINAEASQGYVLYKAEQKDIVTADTMEWSTGSPVKDMGFDSYNFDEWTPSSTTADNTDHITIENNDLGNAHLYIKGTNDGQVEQTITGLTPGQVYSASVWCITDDGRDATIEVQNGDEVVSTYMNRSNVTYGIHHNDKYKTNAQRMFVRFTAASDTAVLRLKAAEGATAQSVVDFDDVRVTKVAASTNPNPEKYTYWEDFENTDQGFGLFVSTESDQSHLSQVNPKNPELTGDVINGTYSLKIRAGDYVRTIPSSVRLQPNTEYTVGISYKAGTANAFTFAVKSDKAQESGDNAAAVLQSVVAPSTEGELTLKFTTGNYDDYYIDITKNAATEYYLDDFYVQEARPMNYDTLQLLISEAQAIIEENYTPESYADMVKALETAKTMTAESPKEEIVAAYKALDDALQALVPYANVEDKDALHSLIVEMKSLLESDYKVDEQWIAFQSKIAEAEALYSDSKATQPQVNAMMEALRAAKNELNPMVDRTALHAIMEKAAMVSRGDIVDGAELQSFLSAQENAANADIKPGVTEAEIQAATDELTAAYQAIILKDESKDTMVANALILADEDESYFLAADWAAIQEAKTAFQAMQGQSGVKAADYYDNLIKLQQALENKLSRPVIPSAVEIDPSNFAVSTNTEQAQSGSEGPVKFAFDKNPGTYWHSAWSGFNVSPSNPAEVTVDMGQSYLLNQFSYLQRPSGDNGKIQKYNLFVKENEADEWTQIITDGTFASVGEVQKVGFDAVQARYVKIQVTQGVGNFASAAEFALYQKASDFAALQTVMNTIDKLDKTLYTTASYEPLAEKYAQAEKLLENLLTAQDEIDQMTSDLNSLVEALVLKATESDIKMLSDAVASAEKVNLEDYTNTAAFEKALKEAQDVLKKAQDAAQEVSQAEVRAAALNLITEHNNLVLAEKPVDKGQLEQAVNGALSDSEAAKYTEASWNAYKAALAAAQAVLNDPNATQKQIDDALATLNQAKAGLLPVEQGVDKSMLQQAINGALPDSEASKYTQESWNAYKAALEAAQKVFNDPNATSQQVKDALNALTQARNGLTLVSSTVPGGNGQSSSGSSIIVQTGDTSQIGIMIVLALVAAAGIALLVIQQKKKKQ